MNKNIAHISLVISILAIGILAIQSCYYDNEEELYGEQDCSTETVSYSEDIVPLLTAQCLQCHSQTAQFGGVILEGYDAVLVHVNNGRLFGSLNHDQGFSAMPPNGPQLDDCTLLQVQSWISAGAPNN